MNEYYKRLETIIGTENINKLSSTNVLIVGLGGVGGASFEALVRSFVGTIYVCDYDKFEESNINRQILSNINNIGNYKVNIAEKRAKEINPLCKIIKINNKISEDNINNLIDNKIDYIIDACDDVSAKVELIKFSIENNIKIISSMGTGNKVHPELLEITNIWKTEYDPLAKKIRSVLRKENINYKLPVVSSKERPTINDNKVIGSFAPVTNTAGMLLASYVLNNIIKEGA